MQGINNKVISIVYGHGRGFVFTPKVFSSLGNPRVIGMVLNRLCRKETIHRWARWFIIY
jgi:hypothetical protein